MTLRVGPQVPERFKARGQGYQTELNAVLETWVSLRESSEAYVNEPKRKRARSGDLEVKRASRS